MSATNLHRNKKRFGASALGGILILLLTTIACIFPANLSIPWGTTTATATLTNTSTPLRASKTPTISPTRRPYQTPTPSEIIEVMGYDCITWKKLTSANVGEEICVFGKIVRIYTAGDYAQIIRLSADAGSFLIWDKYYYYPELSVGECVAIIGTVEQDASSLYMDIAGALMYGLPECP